MIKSKLAIAAFLGIAMSTSVQAADESTVREIQREVNLKLTFLAERGGRDVWKTPLISGRGDCEDFALLKKKMLIDAGWDESDLHIIIVYRQTKATDIYEGHAVLYIKSIDTVLDSSIDGNPRENVNPEQYDAFMEKNSFMFFCAVKDASDKSFKQASDRCGVYSKNKI